LLLNWFVFGPLFLSVVLVPDASFDVLIWLNYSFGTVNMAVLGIAALLLLIGLAMSMARASIAGSPRPGRDLGTASSPGQPPLCLLCLAADLSRGPSSGEFRCLASDNSRCDALGSSRLDQW